MLICSRKNPIIHLFLIALFIAPSISYSTSKQKEESIICEDQKHQFILSSLSHTKSSQTNDGISQTIHDVNVVLLQRNKVNHTSYSLEDIQNKTTNCLSSGLYSMTSIEEIRKNPLSKLIPWKKIIYDKVFGKHPLNIYFPNLEIKEDYNQPGDQEGLGE